MSKKDSSEYEDILERIEHLVGKISGAVKFELLDALDEDEQGVLSLAQEIRDQAKITRKAGAFIAAFRDGQHVGHRGASSQRKLTTPEDAFNRLFSIKLDVLETEMPAWSQQRCEDEALDYAVSVLDRMPVSSFGPGQSPQTLEEAKLVELGRPRPKTPKGPERDSMGAEWARIGWCLHNPKIAAMHREMRKTIGRHDHAAARDMRAALIAEIEHLGVQPRPFVLKDMEEAS